jgi:galacturan 1,4-alpha-galacturonidase
MISSFVTALVLGLTSICGVQGLASKNNPGCCTVPANGDGSDDVPNVLKTFSRCRIGRTIVFSENTTYYMNSVLNTTDLKDVNIQIHGKLLV